MQADRHHLRLLAPLSVEDVEGISQECEELVGRRESAAHELRVVVDEAIGHDKVAAATDFDPIGKLVVVGVRIVEEATFLDDEAARVEAWPIATVPAERPRADR